MTNPDDGGYATHARVSFLIGAGFSASAGVPTVSAIQAELAEHPVVAESLRRSNQDPSNLSYQNLMARLTPSLRAELVRKWIGRAAIDSQHRVLKLNWAHLLLAAMVQRRYVNLILTTNFDPLLSEAVSLVGAPVRTLDLPNGTSYSVGSLSDGSIVYLHGSESGMRLCNTEAEMSAAGALVNPVLRDATQDSVLIVVGYSGANDPVLREMNRSFPQFHHSLYWVCHSDENSLSGEARSFLSRPMSEAKLISGFDADSFMYSLVFHHLRLPLPTIVMDPLHFVAHQLQRLPEAPLATSPNPKDPPLARAKHLVARATFLLQSDPMRAEMPRATDGVPVDQFPTSTFSIRVATARSHNAAASLLELVPIARKTSDLAARDELIGALCEMSSSLRTPSVVIRLLAAARRLGGPRRHEVLVKEVSARVMQLGNTSSSHRVAVLYALLSMVRTEIDRAKTSSLFAAAEPLERELCHIQLELVRCGVEDPQLIESAVETLRRLNLRHDPSGRESVNYAIGLLWMARRSDVGSAVPILLEAVRVTEGVIHAAPPAFEASGVLGACLRDLWLQTKPDSTELLQRAVRALSAALVGYKDRPDIYVNLALSLWDLGTAERRTASSLLLEIGPLLNRALSLSPTCLEALMAMGRAYAASSVPEVAAAFIVRAIAAHGDRAIGIAEADPELARLLDAALDAYDRADGPTRDAAASTVA